MTVSIWIDSTLSRFIKQMCRTIPSLKLLSGQGRTFSQSFLIFLQFFSLFLNFLHLPTQEGLGHVPRACAYDMCNSIFAFKHVLPFLPHQAMLVSYASSKESDFRFSLFSISDNGKIIQRGKKEIIKYGMREMIVSKRQGVRLMAPSR